MIHDRNKYEDWEKLPDQQKRIEERDWDVLAVFDACRWDAMGEVIEEVYPGYNVEKVKTPAEFSTPDWTSRVWNGDWEDVTYISANPFTSYVNEMDKFGNFDIEEHVGEYIPMYDIADDDEQLQGVPLPKPVSQKALAYEPPIVVHYVQPHLPFIGNFKISVRHFKRSVYSDKLPDVGETKSRGFPYRLVEAGLIDEELVRAAYMDNAIEAVKAAQELVRNFDNVVFTADHGEVLGPDNWDHGGADDPRARIVPWVEL